VCGGAIYAMAISEICEIVVWSKLNLNLENFRCVFKFSRPFPTFSIVEKNHVYADEIQEVDVVEDQPNFEVSGLKTPDFTPIFGNFLSFPISQPKTTNLVEELNVILF